MSTLSLTTSLLAHSLAWALLYSLWQGLLIFITLYVILKALPNMSTRNKYYVSFGAFTAMFLWFADTWNTEFQKLKGITVYITSQGMDPATSTTYAVRTVTADHARVSLMHHILPGIERYFPFIILLYTMGLSFMLFRFMVNVFQLRSLRTKGIIQPDYRWNDFIATWQKELNISRNVQLFISDRVNVPMMLGALKPLILLPIATMNHLNTEQVEAILLHELAHIKRHDYLLNIFQTIAETVLFFNPFIWLISGIIRREREHCCDDLVISCDASPMSYARALAILEGDRINSNKLILAATGHKNQLFHRIKRIMEMKKSNINYSQLTIVLVAFIAITFSIAMFTFSPSFAQKAKGDKTDKSDTTTTTAKKTVYRTKTVTVDNNGKRKEVVKESTEPPMDDADAPQAKGGKEAVSVTVNIDGDDDNSKAPKANAYSYSYAYDGDNIKKMVKDVITITKDAMNNIDVQDMEREIEKGMDNVDWDQISADIDRSIAEVSRELADGKLHKEISIKVRKQLENSKKEMEQAKKEMATARRIRIEQHIAPPAPPAPPAEAVPPLPPVPPAPPARDNNFETMLNKMEKDGLIDRDKNYKIEKDDDGLYINGNKQPADVYHRYERYMKDQDVKIKGHKGSLNIIINKDR